MERQISKARQDAEVQAFFHRFVFFIGPFAGPLGCFGAVASVVNFHLLSERGILKNRFWGPLLMFAARLHVHARRS